MLKQYGNIEWVKVPNGRLFILCNWDPVENFVDNVEKYLNIHIESVCVFDGLYIYLLPSCNVTSKNMNLVEDYAIFRFLPNSPCLD